MPRVIVESGDSLPVPVVPTDTSTWFFADMAARGSHLKPVHITSPSRAEGLIGERVAYSLARSAIDVVGSAWFARVVGPNPVAASVDLAGTGGTTLTVTAKEVGEFADGANDGYTLDIIDGPVGGSTFRVIVVKYGGVEVARSPEFDATTRQAAVDWSTADAIPVTVTIGVGTGLPATATGTALAGGDDDHQNATDAEWAAAINRFSKDLGPGQVTMLGRTTSQAHLDTMAAAAATNRKAILDGLNTTVKATLLAAAATLRTNVNAKEGAYYAPWVTYPGVSGAGTRVLPPSPFVAAAYARNDPLYGPDQPAAGDWGVLTGAIGLPDSTLSDDDYDDLNDAGVNMLREIYGVFEIMGARTLADPATSPTHYKVSNERLEMLIKARAAEIAQRFVGRKIDGQGVAMADWHGQLGAMMGALYLNGDLYPDPTDPRPETAFRVDTGSDVNTPESLQADQLLADIYFVPAPFAEMIKVTVTNVPIGTPLAA